jgi:hypothetical protein
MNMKTDRMSDIWKKLYFRTLFCTQLYQIFYVAQYMILKIKNESALIHDRYLVFSRSQRFINFRSEAREGYMKKHMLNHMVLNPKPEVP